MSASPKSLVSPKQITDDAFARLVESHSLVDSTDEIDFPSLLKGLINAWSEWIVGGPEAYLTYVKQLSLDQTKFVTALAPAVKLSIPDGMQEAMSEFLADEFEGDDVCLEDAMERWTMYPLHIRNKFRPYLDALDALEKSNDSLIALTPNENAQTYLAAVASITCERFVFLRFVARALGKCDDVREWIEEDLEDETIVEELECAYEAIKSERESEQSSAPAKKRRVATDE